MSSPALAIGSTPGPVARSTKQHPLVAQLRRYAEHLRDFSDPLLEAAEKIHEIATSDDNARRKLVVSAIDTGCSALEEIVDETELSESTVERIWDELLEDGEYEERPIRLKTDMSRGRRVYGLFKKTSKIGSSYSRFQGTSHYHNPDPVDF